MSGILKRCTKNPGFQGKRFSLKHDSLPDFLLIFHDDRTDIGYRQSKD